MSVSLKMWAEFTLPTTTPQAKQLNRKTGKVYDSSALKEAKDKTDAYLFKAKEKAMSEMTKNERAYLEHVLPLAEPVKLEIVFCYEALCGHKPGEPYTKKPDWDNLTKLFQDSLVRIGVLDDDRFVSEARITQLYQKRPGVLIRASTW